VTTVLDASALLAWLLDEPGAQVVRDVLSTSVIAAPNWAEVLQKARYRNLDAEEVGAQVLGFGLEVELIDREDAETAAALWNPQSSLSLADRFCIAVGRRLEAPIWTCDREWVAVDERVVVLR
jgi:PIN domain nuclease of toxin-antitoxin system